MASTLYANVHRNLDTSGNISIFVFGTPGEDVTVTAANGFIGTGQIEANGSVSIDIPQTLAMSGTGTNQQGLKITSDGDISAYVSNRRDNSTDLTIVFEEASIGLSYVLASAGDAIGDGGQFSVQATEDGTLFSFSLPDSQTTSISLDAGETFKFSTADFSGNSNIGISTSAGFDLTGTIVSSNQPIAVFSGHSCTNVGSGACDHIVEQMPAISSLSQSYIVAEAFSPSGSGNNLIRVVAAEANTEVRVDGVIVATLEQGEFYEFTLSVSAQVIDVSESALVVQYLQGATTAGEGDPAMSFVPGTDTWLSSYIVATPSGTEALAQNLVNLVVPTSVVSSVQINGADVDDSEFTTVSSTNFSVANIAVAPGVIRVEASEDFQLSLFGFDSFDSFLTFGGASFASGLSNVPPSPANDAFAVDERASVSGNLFANNGNGPDEDLDNDQLVITAINGTSVNVGSSILLASGAQLTVNANGDFTYTASLSSDLAAGDNATETFTYTVSDGRATGQATVTVSVDGINSSPIAVNDNFSTDENTELTVSAASLLSNDSDPDGDLVPEISSVISSANGTAVLTNGDVVFTPDANFSGVASFTYEISDAAGLTNTAVASITVNEVEIDGDFEVVLPDSIGLGQAGQAQINYIGTADASAPTVGETLLFAVSAEGGLVADPLSGGFSGTTFVLANTTAQGAFETIDVSVKGTAGPRSTLGISVQLADINAETEISARVTALQPSFVEASVIARIEANVTAQFGETVGSLTASLATHADQFASLGLNASSATAALSFAIETAGDYGSLEERGKDGSLGQGWSTLADIGLDIDGTSVQIKGLADLGALRALTVDASALYTISNSAGRSVSLSGEALALAAPVRPQFEQGIDGGFQTTSAFSGTLATTASGFSVLPDDGETLFFDQDGNFLQLELSDGLLITASHDANMQVTGFTGPNGASLSFTRDANGNLQSVEDADGEIATFAYNADDRLETVTRPEGLSSFDYNSDGDLTSTTAPGDITGQFTYDTFGRLTNADYGAGALTESFAYDNAGGLTITDGAGRTTELDLLPGSVVGRITDGTGNTSEIIYDENGNIAGVRAPDGTETGFEFDDQGRLTQITDANGAELGFTYDAIGEDPSSFTDAGGNTRSFDYDAGGRVNEATWPDGTTLQFEYDDQGNLTGYSNRRGDDVEFTYDARGRLLSESDGSAGPTTYTYDAQGRLTSATNDQGTTSLSYNTADRVTQIDYPTGKSLSYTYNDAGLRASMSDGGDYNVFYDYDALGRLTGLRDEDSQIVTYEYDGAGNLVREENGNGTVSLFDYDAAGQLTRIENQAPDESINSFNTYTYDAAGQRITNETQDGEWSYGYDAIGQLTSANFTSTNVDIDNKSLTYEYDAAGNRTKVVEDGVETLYTANALNQYTAVGDATFTYDADGNMTSRTDPSGTTDYTYDLDNRLTSVTETDGTVLEFEYDVFGNRVAKTVDGTETEYLVDPFGLGDVVSEFTDGSLGATYAHGLGLAAGEIGGVDAFYDADAVGTVTTLTSDGGSIQNSYLFTPFGAEISEIENLQNSFEFNGTFGVQEDSDEISFMRLRSYLNETGRFNSEDPLWRDGDVKNLYRFGLNAPVDEIDPNGAKSKSTAKGTAGTLEEIEEAAGAANTLTGNRNKTLQMLMDQDPINGKRNAPPLTQEEKDFIDDNLTGKQFREDAGKVLEETGEAVGEGYLTRIGLPWLDDFLFGEEPEDNGLDDDDFPDDFPLEDPVEEREPDYDEPLPERDSPLENEVDDESSLGNPPGARSKGEPHLTTFDGLGYSFQAVGEFVLVSGEDFEIQVRYAAIRPGASVATAVATEVDGNRVAVYGFENDTVFLAINGTAVILAEGESIAVGNGSVHFDSSDNFVLTNGNGDGFTAHILNGREIGAIFNDVRPFLAPGREGAIEGLLGDFDGDRSNDLQLSDGTVLGTSLPSTLLYGDFAEGWRITQDQSFFDYAEGESTETFTDRNFPERPVTLETLDPAVVEAARDIVRATGLQEGTFDFDAAVFDVAVTGDPEFATNAASLPLSDPDLEVVEVNIAPIAGDDTAEVEEDGTVDIVVLDNDTDFEGDALSVLSASDENGGVATVVGDQVKFTPFQDFNGETTVTYQLGDSAGNVVSGTILINVTPLPDAPQANDDSGVAFTTNEDTRFTLGDFISNDLDPDGDPVSLFSVDGSGLAGTLIDNGDGTFSYDPSGAFDALTSGQTAEDTFEYTISDGNGGEDTGLVTVTVRGHENGTLISGTDSSELLEGNALRNAILAEGGDDTVFGRSGGDLIFGQDGADWLFGGSGFDILEGGVGADRIFGNIGNDRIWGGSGNDRLFGGDGDALGDKQRDVFVFKSAANGGGGFDIIRDFENNIDKLDVSGSGYASALDIIADASQVGSHVEIDFEFGGLLRINSLDLVDLDAEDFIF